MYEFRLVLRFDRSTCWLYFRDMTVLDSREDSRDFESIVGQGFNVILELDFCFFLDSAIDQRF